MNRTSCRSKNPQELREHQAFVEFEQATGPPEDVSDDPIAQQLGMTTFQPYRKIKLLARERDVDALIKTMTAAPGTHLSELSCGSNCPACSLGQQSPYL